jgi:DNA invertase Pin-like site-specific DNA recombinase
VKPHVAYFRLSKESRSGGLGLDAQRQSITAYLSAIGGTVIGEFTEIESGKRTDRAELAAAIALCRKTKARLCIAKLDRLARNAAFLLTLRDSGVDFVATDMPHADRLTIGIMAVFAEHEREMIGRRTKDALRAAKRRGIRLGSPDPGKGAKIAAAANRARADQFARNILPIVRDIQSAGVTSLRTIAAALNSRGLRSATNKHFSPQAVANLLARA